MYHLFKGTASLDNKLFLNSKHLLNINFCANNNCSKVFHIEDIQKFPKYTLGAIFLALIWSGALWHMLDMASIRSSYCLKLPGIQIILFLHRYNQIQSQFPWTLSFFTFFFLKSI